jgi:hypothetical protein
MVRADVCDFYMSGDTQQIADDASAVFEDPFEKNLVRDVLVFLLDSQFIVSDLLKGRVWKTLKGAGMGLIMSGPVADCALFTRCERCWAADPMAMLQHKIQAFFRFRDDIWILGCDKDLIKKYYWKMAELAGYYKLECVQFSRSAVAMLQIDVCIENGRFFTVPRFKLTSLGAPLEYSSAHPPGVCLAWPEAVIREYSSITIRQKEADAAKDVFIRRMVEYFTPKWFTDHLETIPAWKKRKKGGDERGSTGSTLWLVLPWHPVWRFSKFSAVVKKFVTKPDSIIMLHGIISEPDVRIAWSNGLPSALHVIRRLSLSKALE